MGVHLEASGTKVFMNGPIERNYAIGKQIDDLDEFRGFFPPHTFNIFALRVFYEGFKA